MARQRNRTADRAPGGRPVGLLLAAVLAATTLGDTSHAQFGPVDAGGHVEYRYYLTDANGMKPTQTHAATLRTNWSTFFWRPWFATGIASLEFTEQKTDTGEGAVDSSSIGGSVHLQFLGRSRFPFSVYYQDNTLAGEPGVFESTERRGWGYGLSQQLSTQRFGTYVLSMARSRQRTSGVAGLIEPQSFSSETWQFTGFKAFTANTLSFESVRREALGLVPRELSSLRTTLRHDYKGSALNIRNVVYLNDEDRGGQGLELQLSSKQALSSVFWRPGNSQRLQLSARGFVREYESLSAMMDSELQSMSVGGTASFLATRELMLAASAGASRAETNGGDTNDSNYADVSARYSSRQFELLGGRFGNATELRFGTRTDDMQGMETDLQAASLRTTNSYARAASFFGRLPLHFRVFQTLGTRHDSDGGEVNLVQHSMNFAWNRRRPRSQFGTRLTLTDYRSYGDERLARQLAALEFSAERNQTRDVSWTGTASLQWAGRSFEQSVDEAAESESLYIVLSLAYRHANLRNIPHLNFTSDLRYRDEGQRTLDPLDPDFVAEFDQETLAWRNRLSYRIGLLEVYGSYDLARYSGSLNSVFLLRVRRYFGT